jgi:hypothetical protein
MQDRTLYSIQESRRLLGGISRNMIYQLLRTGRLASVVIGSRRFISAEAIADLIERSTTTLACTMHEGIGFSWSCDASLAMSGRDVDARR